MPRGKAKPIEEKIAQVRENIASAEAYLKELKAQEKALMKEKEDTDLKKIIVTLKEKGLSVEDALSKLTQE